MEDVDPDSGGKNTAIKPVPEVKTELEKQKYRTGTDFVNKKFFCPWFFAVLRSRSRSRWSRNYLRPGAVTGAGAEMIFLIKMYCSQFGEC